MAKKKEQFQNLNKIYKNKKETIEKIKRKNFSNKNVEPLLESSLYRSYNKSNFNKFYFKKGNLRFNTI